MTSDGAPKVSDRLPYDEGDEAYSKRLLPSANPYAEGDWRHDEWYLGWSAAEQIDDTQAYDWATDSFKN